MPGMAVRTAGATILTLAMCVGGAAPAAAQDDGFLRGAAGYLGIGMSGITTGELDDRLEARGYPTFGSTAVGMNLGAYGVLPSGIMLGGEWHGLIIGDGVHDGRRVGIGGGYGTLGLGYLIERSPRLRVYPRIGLGGGGMGLWFDRDSVVAFDAVLANPRSAPPREPVLSTGTAVIDLGAGAELLLGGWARGLLAGVRLGYLAAPFESNWSMHGVDVSGGPDASVAGPYIRFVVGAGGRM